MDNILVTLATFILKDSDKVVKKKKKSKPNKPAKSKIFKASKSALGNKL